MTDQLAPGLDAEAGFFASLKASLEGLAAGVDGLNKRVDKLLGPSSRVPWNAPLRGSGICPTPTATFSFGIGEPALGRRRSLRQISVGGILWTTAAAGSALFIAAGTDPALTALDTTSVIAYASTLPNIAQWGTGEVELGHGDRLWCIIIGGTQGQQYVAKATYDDYEEGGYAAVQVL